MYFNLLKNKIWRKIRSFSKFSPILCSVVRSWVLFEVRSFYPGSFEVGSFEVGSFEVQSFKVGSFEAVRYWFEVQSFEVQSVNLGHPSSEEEKEVVGAVSNE
jgi:hypothetical protein